MKKKEYFINISKKQLEQLNSGHQIFKKPYQFGFDGYNKNLDLPYKEDMMINIRVLSDEELEEEKQDFRNDY